MKREQRLTLILDLLAERGQIDVDQVVQLVGASPATARRDLDSLAAAALLTRTHGGAITNSAYAAPSKLHREAPDDSVHHIARRGVELVEAGMAIGICSSPLAAPIATELGLRHDLNAKAGRALTVVTNSIEVASVLAVRPHIQVVVTGGQLDGQNLYLHGTATRATMDLWRLDLSFIGADALAPGIGVMYESETLRDVSQLFAQQSVRCSVAVQSEKIGGSSFSVLGQSLLHDLITDPGLSAEQRALWQEAGVRVLA